MVFNGVWWVPDARGMYTRQFTGTLTHYGDKPSTLELINEPNSGSIAAYGYYDVIWGQDAIGVDYSLFAVSMVKERDFTKITFLVRYILVGKHVKSLDEACFDTCCVKYQYLNHWALDSRFDCSKNGNVTVVSLDVGIRDPFLSVITDDGLRLFLWGQISNNLKRYEITATQVTNLSIDVPNNVSLITFINKINEFSRFLSIALFAEQHPREILFANKGVRINYPLLFDTVTSTEPWVLPLIKNDELKERMPDILKQWHSNYAQITPICNYLIRSLKRGDAFDAPDFLIVAQALDGYFKRFVNKKDGKDTKQYKRQIEMLLNAFRDVEAVKECNIDPDVLTQTRHKYSHLIPDDDENYPKAVEGEDLYWLTQKCVVLLSCCILHMLGLTTDEINLCCMNSPIEQIVNSIPF